MFLIVYKMDHLKLFYQQEDKGWYKMNGWGGLWKWIELDTILVDLLQLTCFIGDSNLYAIEPSRVVIATVVNKIQGLQLNIIIYLFL